MFEENLAVMVERGSHLHVRGGCSPSIHACRGYGYEFVNPIRRPRSRREISGRLWEERSRFLACFSWWRLGWDTRVDRRPRRQRLEITSWPESGRGARVENTHGNEVEVSDEVIDAWICR